MSCADKKFTIIAGPNGSGKTAFVHDLFPHFLSEDKFINADHIARELYPEDVEGAAIKAGRQFLKAVDHLIESDDSFIIETTLSGKGLLKSD